MHNRVLKNTRDLQTESIPVKTDNYHFWLGVGETYVGSRLLLRVEVLEQTYCGTVMSEGAKSAMEISLNGCETSPGTTTKSLIRISVRHKRPNFSGKKI